MQDALLNIGTALAFDQNSFISWLQFEHFVMNLSVTKLARGQLTDRVTYAHLKSCTPVCPAGNFLACRCRPSCSVVR